MSPNHLARIAPASESEDQVIALAHGRSLAIEGSELRLRSPDGELELELEITATGPRLRIRAVDLDLVAARRVSVECEDFELRCRRDLSLEAGGDQRVTIAGVAHHEAHATTIETRRGDLTLRANDDARVEGERVLLNS